MDEPAGRADRRGGPLLQVDAALCDALQPRYWVAVETNGTIPIPPGVFIDHVTVSPKKGAVIRQKKGSELKLVYPQPGAEPERFAALAFAFRSCSQRCFHRW